MVEGLNADAPACLQGIEDPLGRASSERDGSGLEAGNGGLSQAGTLGQLGVVRPFSARSLRTVETISTR